MTLFFKQSFRSILFFLFLFLISIKIHSQEQAQDSIAYSKSDISWLIYPEQNPDPIIYKDTVILYSPYFPIIFDAAHLNLSRPLTPECQLTKPLFPPFRIAHHKLFSNVNKKNTIDLLAYDYLIKYNIPQIKYTRANFQGKIDTIEEIPSNIFHFLFKIDSGNDGDNASKPERFRPKRRYWTLNGDHKIQLSQNFISNNWYQGGVENLNLLNMHTLNFNYKKNKFQSNHTLEWRFSIYTNPNDTVRIYRIGEDMVRTYSNFGFQAFNNWYYSANIEIKTQIFKNFDQNSPDAFSSAFSPLYVNIGLFGMRYQIDKTYPKVKGKKLTLSTDISPFSIQYITVLNKNIDPQRFGIDEGKRSIRNFGSKVNIKLDFNMNKNVKLNSRFDYFTNYKNVTAEFENKLDMPINRYFSTTLYLYIRYDDNSQLTKDKDLGYFQLNELLTLGFSYKW